MECFTQQFTTVGNFPYPGKPIQFTTLAHARNAYAEFVQDCDNFGMGVPYCADVWIGKISEVDKLNGVYLYPEFPYKRFEVGPKGGIKTINW